MQDLCKDIYITTDGHNRPVETLFLNFTKYCKNTDLLKISPLTEHTPIQNVQRFSFIVFDSVSVSSYGRKYRDTRSKRHPSRVNSLFFS